MEETEISTTSSENQTNILTPPAEDPYCSDQINDIALALSKAQGEYLPVAQSRQNPFFKSQYADLDAYITAARPALTKHGLAFYQFTKLSANGPTVLHTRLIHSSGQWIESRSRIIPIKNDMQAYGSALSYQRRYSAMTLLGITSNNDPLDDDGEATLQMRK